VTRVGFFAGSFDPPTLGHLDLVRRARDVVDEVVLGIGVNVDKTPWIAAEERRALLAELLPSDVRVVTFTGLAVTAAQNEGATILLRGVRGESDMAGELAMALANRRLAPELETIVLIGSPEVAHISSRLVREVADSGGEIAHFVPPLVVEFLRKRGGRQPD
jgi:pantetheine-phosphate adenylyltransferase